MKKGNEQLLLPIEHVRSEGLLGAETLTVEMARAKASRLEFGSSKNEKTASSGHAEKCMAFYRIFAEN